MRRLALLAPLAAAALLAGCGSSSSSSSSTAAASSGSSSTATSTPATASGGGSQLTLSEKEFKITPASPGVAHTGTITITVKNTGTITHALSVQTPSGVVSTGKIAPGASTTLKVNAAKAGHYTFFCPIDGHRASGMQGVLVVGSSSSSTSGAAPATSSSSSTTSSKYGY
jgi:uncharacterized cupredoxin-like copper-binding protein